MCFSAAFSIHSTLQDFIISQYKRGLLTLLEIAVIWWHSMDGSELQAIWELHRKIGD